MIIQTTKDEDSSCVQQLHHNKFEKKNFILHIFYTTELEIHVSVSNTLKPLLSGHHL